MDGKRSPKEEPEVAKQPAEKVITLPDGRQITVPADFQPGDMRRMRGGDGQGLGAQPGIQQRDSTKQSSRGNQQGGQSVPGQSEPRDGNRPAPGSGSNN
jgi:hypothetical protein